MEPKVYRQEKLIFIIEAQKVVVRTPFGQQFYLNPKTKHWRRRLLVIIRMIEINEIRNLNELAEWCASGSIEWVNSYKKYELEKTVSV